MRLYLVRHGETPWNEEMRYQGQSDVPLSEKGRKQAEALHEAHFANQNTEYRIQNTEVRIQKSEIKIAKVYSSDLQRALETAKILVGQTDDPKKQVEVKYRTGNRMKKNNIEKGVCRISSSLPIPLPLPAFPEPRTPEIITCEGLREINYGVFEGALLEDIKKNYSDVLQQWWRDPLKARIPDGESLEELETRVLRCYSGIVNAQQEKAQDALIVSHGGPLRIIFMHVLGFSLAQVRSFRVDNTSLSIVEYRNGKSVLTLLNDTCHLEIQATGNRQQATGKF